MPFQKYSECNASQQRAQTAAGGSKRRLLDNVNNYDHNILGLGSRAAVPGANLTSVPRSPNRGKSRVAELSATSITPVAAATSKPVDSVIKGLDAHKVSHLDYLQNDSSVRYEDYRKNRTKSPISERSRPQTSQPISQDKKGSNDVCANCYNSKLIAEKSATKPYKEKTEPVAIEKIKEDSTVSKQQLSDKKQLERQILNDDEGISKSPLKSGVSPKITETQTIDVPYIYQYEGYGADHQKETENAREQIREQLRAKVEEKLLNDKPIVNKEKLLNLEAENGGNLSLPSFKPKPNTRAEYKSKLLEQIERDRQKRMQGRESGETMPNTKMEELTKGAYIDIFSDKRKGLKQEYYESMKTIEQKKEKITARLDEDKKNMQAAIEAYHKHRKQIDDMKKVLNIT